MRQLSRRPSRTGARAIRTLFAGVLALGVALGVTVAGGASATADAKTVVAAAGPITTQDACYTWPRTLRRGMNGEDVRQLQIRVAGWMSYNEALGLDGDFGPATEAAVRRFQSGYGLGSDGVAGPQTFGKIYELQDDDCTPIHFTYAELNHCNSDYSGSSVASPATARANALKVMWQLEGLRRQLGDRPLNVTSGFRSDACNRAAGGASDSMHRYGLAADLGAGSQGFCAIWRKAHYAGFTGLLGPGYPGHNDHVHADSRHLLGRSAFRSAPNC